MKYILFLIINLSFLVADDMSFKDDKKKHLAISFVLGTISGIYIDKNYNNYTYKNKILIGTSIALLPGLIKEIYDSKQKDNYFSKADLAYDLLGAMSGNIFAHYLSDNILLYAKKKEVYLSLKF